MGDLQEAARGRWPGILAALAGLSDQQLTDRHQPCPLCGGEDRYRFDDRDGNGTWFCNRCGGKNQAGGAGNGMDMLMRRNGWDYATAAKRLEEHLGISRPARPAPARPAQGPPVQGSEAHWRYSDTFVVARFPGKKIRPLSWNGSTWEWKAPPAPRPLLNLAQLAARPDAAVLVVEGEKTCDAAARLFPSAVAITWASGCKAIDKTDWQPLAGRKVVLWPDADKPGTDAMQRLGQKLLRLGAASVRLVSNPPEAPEGWDLADATWTPQEASAYVRDHLTDVEPEPEPQPEPPVQRDLPEPSDPATDTIPNGTGKQFRCLGFDGDTYYYLPRATGQVVKLTASQHGGAGLLRLADLAYWESLYPGARTGVNWNAAISSLFTEQARIGVYDPDRIRGRGAWRDNGRVVFHLGDRLIVDGTEHSVLTPPKTRYFYEQARQLDGPGETPLSDQQAAGIRAIAERFRWEVPASFHLLLGWIVLAPVCGALNWRPHIWITGGAGTGKTTILKSFIHPLLGGIVQSATGGTTEAGLRGTLKSDAIPVVFDEFEQNEAKDKAIVQNVLALARIASSEGGKIYKGTTSGGANSFEIRSMFCVSSINVSLVQKADVDRFCVLGLRNAGMDKDEWREFALDIANACTIDTGRALIARTVQQIPTITENAKVLAQALGRRFGQRFGDQHGTLLAGAWSLEPNGGGRLSLEQAEQWIDQMDWQQAQPDATDADEVKCRDTILQTVVRIGGGQEASIGEMAQAVARQQYLHEVHQWNSLQPVLSRHGVKVYRPGDKLPDRDVSEGYWLAISNTNLQLRAALRDTPWANGSHKNSLRRLPGAVVPKGTVYMGSTCNRVTLVPLPEPEP